MTPIALLFCAASALLAAGCTTSQEVAASKDRLNSAARAIVGTSLVGTRGASPADQERIDETAARLCGAHVWTRSECARHGGQDAL